MHAHNGLLDAAQRRPCMYAYHRGLLFEDQTAPHLLNNGHHLVREALHVNELLALAGIDIDAPLQTIVTQVGSLAPALARIPYLRLCNARTCLDALRIPFHARDDADWMKPAVFDPALVAHIPLSATSLLDLCRDVRDVLQAIADRAGERFPGDARDNATMADVERLLSWLPILATGYGILLEALENRVRAGEQAGHADAPRHGVVEKHS